MEKEIFFINGMPRSGSTLLCNILAQNPNFHTTPTSGLSDIVSNIHAMWQQNPSIKASEPAEKQLTIIKDLFQSYHSDTDRPIVFNKSRGWAHLIELVELSLNHPIKILTTTRKIPCILASMEKLYRREISNINSPMIRTPDMAILSGRVSNWASPEGLVGGTFNSLVDAFGRGHRNKFHLIDYDELTTNPRKSIKLVYDFLEKPYFEHDFKNIIQYTSENDAAHGFSNNLHTIRAEIKPQRDDSKEILGSLWEHYSGFNYKF